MPDDTIVPLRTSLDHITTAVNLALVHGEGAIRTYFQQSMDDGARLRFDGFLVKTGDALAFQYGPCEDRFFARCNAMLVLARSSRRAA